VVSGTGDRRYISAIRKALKDAAVPTDAKPMQAYMKSDLPFCGVKKPLRAKCSKRVIGARPLESYEAWRDTATTLFRHAKRREERYCALDLVGHRHYREYRDRWTSFSMYEEFIVTGAWWDLVDECAVQHVGRLMAVHNARCTKKMRRWMVSRDMWRRRTSIICQLKLKADTDESLLFDAIVASADSDEFFLRKGIGWALREYAKIEPERVIRFVKKHRKRLSSLSKKEALRRLVAQGLTEAVG
jgi:3-methyladenine DNA glycosylase AlkD